MPAFNYCPSCGSPLTINHAAPFAEQKCFCCGATHYHNSKPTASALIVEADRGVLLSQRAGEPFRGDWDVPGGFLEAGENPLDGARREVREETGLEVELSGPWATYIGRYGPTGDFTLNLYYRATVVSGEARPADDVAALRWFPIGKLPANLAFDHERALLSRLAEELRF